MDDAEGRAERERLRILDALVVVTEDRDEFMRVVGAADSGDIATARVQRHYDFDEAQATAVLDLQVRRFAQRERRRIVEEREQLRGSLAGD